MSSPALPTSLGFRADGDVAILTLRRPAKRNALDDATIEGLASFFRAPPANLKAAVLAGEGEHFSAGLDLGEVVGMPDGEQAIHHSQMWHRAFAEIEHGRLPVISVLHGAVVGGGLELAAATHIRVAERSAFYALPEGQRGIFLGGGGSVRITRLIGVARVQDLMLTGRVLSAAEGYGLGLSQYLVESGEGLAKALELARKAATIAPLTRFAVLSALPRIAESPPAAGLMTESLMAALAEMAPEAQQRLADFLAKRAPKVTREG
jgi:enoyl-CoA hydratase/carnithine racemase